ncbi:facilitated trehalose transporter Tret1-2 homolog [Battus philenor]|uniref:facilitated trehalose transporter Tret1-2 homolog n=1 Tax=Battus philenor TaxID=42288 RepID=UPI0035CF6728
MQGVNHAANVTISVIIISEYTSPRYRGMFLTIKSATFFWGVWISNTIGIIFLFIISLYLYLVELSILTEMNILSITLFIAFFVPISCGPMIMTTSIYGEIIPLRFKTVSFVIIALVNEVYITSFLKIAPFLFKSLGLHGAFLFYGIAAGFCTFILYLVLPETKDKTLQEIEEYFK